MADRSTHVQFFAFDPKRSCCDFGRKHLNVRITLQIVSSREVRSLIASRKRRRGGWPSAAFSEFCLLASLANKFPQVFKSIVAAWV